MNDPIYEGHIDTVDDEGRVSGWVWNKRSAEPVTIMIRIDGQDVEQFTAALPRRDLKAAGRHDGNHGFLYLIPEELRVGSMEFEVLVAENKQALIGSPRTLTFEQPKKWRLFSRRKSQAA